MKICKLTLWILAALLCAVLTACGGQNAATETPPDNAAQETDSVPTSDDAASGSRDAVANEPHHETDVALAGTLKDIPDAYLTPAANQGTLTTISYQATDRAGGRFDHYQRSGCLSALRLR